MPSTRATSSLIRVGELSPEAKQAVATGRSVTEAVSAGRQTVESVRRLPGPARLGLALLALVGVLGLAVRSSIRA